MAALDGEIAEAARAEPMALGIARRVAALVGHGGAGEVAVAAPQIAEPIERARAGAGVGRFVAERGERGHRLRLGTPDEAAGAARPARAAAADLVEEQGQRRDQERDHHAVSVAPRATSASAPSARPPSGQRDRRDAGAALQPPSISG